MHLEDQDEQTNSTTDTDADQSQASDKPNGSTTTPDADADDKGKDKGGDTILTGDDDDADKSGKGADDKDAPAAKKGEDDGAGDENPLLGVPDGDYEIDTTALPDGTVVDDAALAAFAPVAKEIGLSNAGMTRIAGVYAETVLPTVTKQITDQIEADVVAQRKDWDTMTRAQVEGGTIGDAKVEPLADYGGASFKEVRAAAARALDRFGDPEFRQFLDDSGLGNHPAMVKFAFIVGKSIKEDDISRDPPSAGKRTSEEKFYGTT